MKCNLLAEQVQKQIYQYVLELPDGIGTKLPNEFELAKKFGVGRSTVREAVKLLISKGILEVRRGAGTYVISTVPSDMDPLGLGTIKDKAALAMDLVDVRILLEPSIAEMAALKATERDVEQLKSLCDAVEDKIARGEAYIEEDVAFHAGIAKCSRNTVVEQLIPIIDEAVMMFVHVTHNKLIQETIATHRAVVEAIAEKDVIGARTAMMMHMIYNRDKIKEEMQRPLI